MTERNINMRDTIDGASFQRMVIHAAASINSRKQEINELNVSLYLMATPAPICP